MPPAWNSIRRAALAALAGTAVTASVLSVPGSGWADDRTAPVSAAAGTVTPADAPGTRTTVKLATGERLDVIRRPGSKVQIAPVQGTSVGPYAYASTGGALTVQPLDRSRSLPATKIATNTQKPLAKASTAAAATYPVKFDITSKDWVYGKSIYIWNTKTWVYYPVKNEYGTPRATASLPAGDYFSVALYGEWGRPNYVLVKSFKVANAGLTVQFQESTAKETAIKVDDPTARRHTSAVWLSLPNGDMAGFAGGGAANVYVTPFSRNGVTLRVNDLLVKQGTSASTATPYIYNLFREYAGTVPSSPVTHVRSSSLAKTLTWVRAQGDSSIGLLSAGPMTGDWSVTTLSAPVKTGKSVTQYFTPGVSFLRDLIYGQGNDHRLELPTLTAPAGTSPGETLGVAPFAPRRIPHGASQRTPAKMYLYEPYAFTDARGNSGFDARARMSYRLTSKGRTIASAGNLAPYDGLAADVTADRAEYELDHTVTRTVPYSRLSTRIESEWKFSSDSTGAAYEDLPLVDVDFTLSGINANNTATSSTPVRVTAAAATRHFPNATNTVTGLEYSTDDGAHWAALPVSGSKASVSAEIKVPSTASFVSLRASAKDDNGTSLRRTVIRAFAGPKPQGDRTVGTTKIANVTVNGGKPIRFDASGSKEIKARFTATDPSGIIGGDLYLYHGSYTAPDGVLMGWSPATCTKASVWTSSCEVTFYIDARDTLGRNALAGPWKVAAWANAGDKKSYADLHAVATVSITGLSRLTANATPEPVRKGGTLTVTGKLTRANWETGTYTGYAGQYVKLQFRKSGTSTYVTKKTVKTDASGNLRTTVAASANGFWRYVYAGSSTTVAVTSAADGVVVR
ncbi:hypothetical protein GCM10023194_05780 [Planotetraspora phitsanulokensis]|uniref:Uncharacterized protein n=1 Tax=Planotetraspora phitsanulokensis TaxID=575192 RepID=A0A8J3UAR9_9ACTN|nr:hypothetical protein [Planotetraspora phitsanulokensis]GII39074.1 hypothetical protein Pph01_40770 [Planotetraspora phitsanulokensis]